MARHRLRLGALVAAVLCAVALASPIDTPAKQTVPEEEVAVTVAFAADVPSSTRAVDVPSSTEGSKMSRFLDDFTSAFKQGTAKMKESLESAASSVKDGVLQGYDFVRSKLTGAAADGPVASGVDPPTVATTPTVAARTSDKPSSVSSPAPSTERPATSANSGLPAYGGAVGVSHEPAKIVPNDDDDDERIIFNDKDYLAEKSPDGEDERYVTETPAASGVTIDNRFIIASPLACKSGQEVVNGKCRNVF